MKLQEAKYIKIGTTSATKVMLGNTQVWPKQDNNHLLYGEVVDASQALPTISLDGTVNTPTLDAATNMFYLDSWSNAAPTSMSFDNKSNIKTITKMQLDTSNVTDMREMFDGCSSLVSLDLSNWDTSKVTNMQYMFYNCSSLVALDLSNLDTSKLTNMNQMLNNCSSLVSLDLSNWDTSKVTNMERVFVNCSALKDVYITVEATLNKLTNNLTSHGGYYIPSTATIHYNDVDYKWENNKWTNKSDVNNHVLYGEVVDQSQALPTITLNGTTNTPKLDAATNMFYLDSWSNAAPTKISFDNKSNIKSITKLKGLDTSSVTDMREMFNSCSSLTSLDLSNFNTSNVTTMNGMFWGCSSLTALDLSNFNTPKVTNMSWMFTGCRLLTSFNLSNFNTSKVTNMSYMFSGCSSLISLDLSSFDASNVTDMSYMFNFCLSLTSLDLSNFNTSKVTDMNAMFYNCSLLKDVYITVEATLNKLTNNLTSAGDNYIPSTATIHYNNVDYKWNGSAWTPQN